MIGTWSQLQLFVLPTNFELGQMTSHTVNMAWLLCTISKWQWNGVTFSYSKKKTFPCFYLIISQSIWNAWLCNAFPELPEFPNACWHLQKLVLAYKSFQWILLTHHLPVKDYFHSFCILLDFSKFSFCQYPFILSLAAKRYIMQKDSESQMIVMARVSEHFSVWNRLSIFS